MKNLLSFHAHICSISIMIYREIVHILTILLLCWDDPKENYLNRRIIFPTNLSTTTIGFYLSYDLSSIFHVLPIKLTIYWFKFVSNPLMERKALFSSVLFILRTNYYNYKGVEFAKQYSCLIQERSKSWSRNNITVKIRDFRLICGIEVSIWI